MSAHISRDRRVLGFDHVEWMMMLASIAVLVIVALAT